VSFATGARHTRTAGAFTRFRPAARPIGGELRPAVRDGRGKHQLQKGMAAQIFMCGDSKEVESMHGVDERGAFAVICDSKTLRHGQTFQAALADTLCPIRLLPVVSEGNFLVRSAGSCGGAREGRTPRPPM
jgi:hypothetical protein